MNPDGTMNPLPEMHLADLAARDREIIISVELMKRRLIRIQPHCYKRFFKLNHEWERVRHYAQVQVNYVFKQFCDTEKVHRKKYRRLKKTDRGMDSRLCSESTDSMSNNGVPNHQ